jgi:hypothetical protein
MRRSGFVILALLGTWGTPAYSGPADIMDEGVGLYTDASVAGLVSTFTINRQIVSCGVGTFDPSAMPFDSFGMLMYAKDTRSYKANHLTQTIRATGTMRSITQVNGITVEDVDHEFLAIALDRAGSRHPDRFDIHFASPFWNTGNPFCTPSAEVAGGCRFGGELFSGDVTVGR